LLVCGHISDNDDCESTKPTLAECRQAIIHIREGNSENIATSYSYNIEHLYPGRVIFRTENGYIGLGPARTKPGDVVGVFLGCTIPLLLRRVPGRKEEYHVVGGCYVQSLMLGELFLGNLPDNWRYHSKQANGMLDIKFAFKDQKPTCDDPRLGPLPPDWEFRGDGIAKAKIGVDDSGRRWYENVRTGEETWSDPRMTSEGLRARGVAIKDFILV